MYPSNGSASYISHHPHHHHQVTSSTSLSSPLKDGYRDKMMPQSPYDHPPPHHQSLSAAAYHGYAPSAAAAASMDYGSRISAPFGSMTSSLTAAAAMTSPLSAAMATAPFFGVRAADCYPPTAAPVNYAVGSDLMTSSNQHYSTLSTSSRKTAASFSSSTSLSAPSLAALWPTGSSSTVGGMHEPLHDVVNGKLMSPRCGVGSAFGPFYGDKMAPVWNSPVHLGDTLSLTGFHGLQGGSCHQLHSCSSFKTAAIFVATLSV